MTGELWGPAPKPLTFIEKVSAFLISSDGKTLVAVGKDDHYIFSLPSKFKRILEDPIRKKLKPEINSVFVSENGKFEAVVTVTLPKEIATKEDIEQAYAAGLRSHYFGPFFGMRIRGTRYSAKNFKYPADLQRLTTPVQFLVTIRRSRETTPDKVLMTPVTLAGDYVSALTLGAAGLISIPFLLTSRPAGKATSDSTE